MSGLHLSRHPLVAHKLTLLRDAATRPKDFRELVREVATLVGAEATLDLKLRSRAVDTPLGPTEGEVLAETIGLVPILRAGLGMVEGMWRLLPGAEVWHLGLYRDEDTLTPVTYYNKLPVGHTVQCCLLLDPMLATGGSSTAAINTLKRWGAQRIKYVGILGAPEGVEAVQREHPDVPIHLAGLDEQLNDQGFILPGLGDAGDRQFGTA